MFGQLFGRYLVEKGIITNEDYKGLIQKQLSTRAKLGTIAVAEGLLTEEQAEHINKLQKQFDKRFGDIAVEKGLLAENQIEDLLKKQGNPYMQFLEVVLESGKIPVSQLDEELDAFQKDNGFTKDDLEALKHDDFERIVPIFAVSSKPYVTELVCLVLRNINRFVSRDFYIGKITRTREMEYTCLAGQRTVGEHNIQIALAAQEDTRAFLRVTSGFAGEEYQEVKEDVLDAACEFINCMSGLFAAAQSEKDMDFDMEPVYAYEKQDVVGDVYVLPIFIEDRELQLIIAVDSDAEMGQIPHKFAYEKMESSIAIGLAKGRVVVVDDSKMSRKVLRNILEEAGYAVVEEATDGEEAIAAYMQYKPDILTLDITMPNMDGIEALKEIMSLDRRAKVVMISAAGQQKKIIEALKLGAQKFVTKPFEQDEVIECVDAMMK